MRSLAAPMLALALGCGDGRTEEQTIEIQWGKDDSDTSGFVTLDEHSPRASGRVTCNRAPGCHLALFIPVEEGVRLHFDQGPEADEHEVGRVLLGDADLPLTVGVREVHAVASGAELGPPGYLYARLPELHLGDLSVLVEKAPGAQPVTLAIRADFENGCLDESHCRYGETCLSGSCVRACGEAGACEEGSACVEGGCVPELACDSDLACPADARCDRAAGLCTIF